MQRVAVVTGSSGGIGSALCHSFVDNDWRVIGIDNRARPSAHALVEADLARFATDPAYRVIVLDEVRALIGSADLGCLVNNAAAQLVKPIERTTPEDWSETLAVNLTAPFMLIQGLLAHLERGRGSVINIGSIHATMTKPQFVAYATSKAALAGMTRAMAVELGPRVRVNAILPAAIATPMLVDGFRDRPAGLDELSAMHPIGRIGTPEDVAALARFLASESAAFITGATLSIDGGMSARLHDPG